MRGGRGGFMSPRNDQIPPAPLLQRGECIVIARIRSNELSGFKFPKGSHKKFRKGNRTIIVPDPNKEIPLGTFTPILRQSGLSKEDFK